jgi:cellulose synthase/poly-beta-1,6-N-acetylglucosamine synthase-like glycosyltransferase
MWPAVAVGAVAALVAIWGGYPLAVGLLARLKRPVVFPADAGGALVSVIIATRETPDVIRRRVEDVLRTDYPPDRLEVVVALDARDARARVSDLQGLGSRVRVVVGDPPGGKVTALNAAVRNAGGEVLVFADSMQRFEPAAIRHLAAAARDPRFGAVSGVLRLAETGRRQEVGHWYWAYETWLRACEARLHSSVGVFGPIYAMRRALWSDLPARLILDDVFTPMRLVSEGLRIGLAPDAVAHDLRPPAAPHEYRRKARTLTGVIQLCAWQPAVLLPYRNAIWLQFLCHKILRLLTPYLVLVAVLGGVGALAQRMDRSLLVPLALALTVVVAVSGARSMRLRDSVVWAVLVQLAVLKATWNGLRGDWNVWHR